MTYKDFLWPIMIGIVLAVLFIVGAEFGNTFNVLDDGIQFVVASFQ